LLPRSNIMQRSNFHAALHIYPAGTDPQTSQPDCAAAAAMSYLGESTISI
jgi:hypothetical protein